MVVYFSNSLEHSIDYTVIKTIPTCVYERPHLMGLTITRRPHLMGFPSYFFGIEHGLECGHS